MKKVVKAAAPVFSRKELLSVAEKINTLVKKEDMIVTSKYKEIVPLMEAIFSTANDIEIGEGDYHSFEARDRAVLNQIFNHYSEDVPFPKGMKVPPIPTETEEEEEEDDDEDESEEEDDDESEEEDDDEDDGKPVTSLKGKGVAKPASKPAAKVATKVVAAQTKKAESNNIAKALELLHEVIQLLEDSDMPIKVTVTPKTPAPKPFVKAQHKAPAKPVKKAKEVKEQGIKDVILDYVVNNASKSKGVTNDQILDELCEQFDNDREAMRKTISGIPPKMRTGAISHYLDSEGNTVEIDFEMLKNKANKWYTA